ncbi:DUF1223 domain-containing protein [Parasphingorhabdus sp.]|uniref:DUF1223 domain-containing protein n=1 Tax=Parasphingorhabdus sp. TaxID=2709688 RepID=UPI0030032C84
MRKIIPCLLFAGASVAALLFLQFVPPAQAGSVPVVGSVARPGHPVVIELFTSQGCSSCPPADRLASRLAKDRSLLVITRPVTYWDRLGWTDTLAREANTRLQRAYAAKNREGAGVYTPQIVVNGGGATVGSREGDIRSLVRRADRSGPRILVSGAAGGGMTVTIDGISDHMASVSLVALSSSETVRIGRGENGGRTLHFTNVVRDERVLGSWRGRRERFAVPAGDLKVRGADRYAIVVQQPGAGRIVAAKMLDI